MRVFGGAARWRATTETLLDRHLRPDFGMRKDSCLVVAVSGRVIAEAIRSIQRNAVESDATGPDRGSWSRTAPRSATHSPPSRASPPDPGPPFLGRDRDGVACGPRAPAPAPASTRAYSRPAPAAHRTTAAEEKRSRLRAPRLRTRPLLTSGARRCRPGGRLGRGRRPPRGRCPPQRWRRPSSRARAWRSIQPLRAVCASVSRATAGRASGTLGVAPFASSDLSLAVAARAPLRAG